MTPQRRIALLSATGAVVGACPSGASLVDLVGYGTSDCSQTAPAPAVGNTVGVSRRAIACRDSADNSVDFVLNIPNAHDSLATANTCGCP